MSHLVSQCLDRRRDEPAPHFLRGPKAHDVDLWNTPARRLDLDIVAAELAEQRRNQLGLV